MNIDQKIAERKKKWNSFMSGASDAENVLLLSYFEGLGDKPFVKDSNYGQLTDWIVKKYYAMKNNVSWLDDDAIPYLDLVTGTEIFAETFGCKVVYPQNNNPFALHLLEDISEISKLKTPRLWDTRLADLFELAYKLREKTEKNAVIRIPDIQSPFDIAALILNKEQFYIGIIEEPESIKELVAKTYDLLIQFLDEWFKAFGKEFIAHYPDYYMEYGITLSEDEVGVISTDTFNAMFLKELNDLSLRYGRIGIHCCANSKHQWKNFKNIKNLCLLNLVQPNEIVKKAYPFFETTCAQMHSFYGDGEISSWKQQHLSNARIAYQLSPESREDALKKLNEFRENGILLR